MRQGNVPVGSRGESTEDDDRARPQSLGPSNTDRSLIEGPIEHPRTVILEFESANGITRPLHPHFRNQPEAVISTNRIPDFFNFISRFVASGHPDVDGVLRQIIGRAEHDRMTYQECVKELGRMRTRLAADRIRELFEKPPFRERSPIFQNHCLQAIADIEGQEACSYFEEQLMKVDDKNVVTKLQSLVKQLCQ